MIDEKVMDYDEICTRICKFEDVTDEELDFVKNSGEPDAESYMWRARYKRRKNILVGIAEEIMTILKREQIKRKEYEDIK